MDRLLRVHFTNIAVESCRIETFCTLQPSVSLVSKYLARSLRNNKQDTSRVRFSRRTRFWTLFFCQTVAKSPKPQCFDARSQTNNIWCSQHLKEQNDAATTNRGFGNFPTVWERNRVQKRVLRKKLTLETFCLLFLNLLTRYFEAKPTDVCKVQNVSILQNIGDSTAMLVKCTLK